MNTIYRVLSAFALISFFSLISMLADAHFDLPAWQWILAQSIFLLGLLSSANEMVEAVSEHLPQCYPTACWKRFIFIAFISVIAFVLVSAVISAMISPAFFEALSIGKPN